MAASHSGASKTNKLDGLVCTPDIDIYTSTPAINTSLVAGDYQQIGSTSQTGAPISYADWSTTGYNDFTLDAVGLGNINKTGISKFGVRNANYDVSGSPPNWDTENVSYLRSELNFMAFCETNS